VAISHFGIRTFLIGISLVELSFANSCIFMAQTKQTAKRAAPVDHSPNSAGPSTKRPKISNTARKSTGGGPPRRVPGPGASGAATAGPTRSTGGPGGGLQSVHPDICLYSLLLI
jgi:hypothetical protein